MLDCLKNPRFSIFINEKPRGRIVASRDIRQGDPLSPFLFLLVSEVLGAIINKLHDSGHFMGFMVGKDRVHILILRYGDDTILFCKDDEAMLLKLKETIILFEWRLGQKVNWDKSALSVVNMGMMSYFIWLKNYVVKWKSSHFCT